VKNTGLVVGFFEFGSPVHLLMFGFVLHAVNFLSFCFEVLLLCTRELLCKQGWLASLGDFQLTSKWVIIPIHVDSASSRTWKMLPDQIAQATPLSWARTTSKDLLSAMKQCCLTVSAASRKIVLHFTILSFSTRT